VPEIAERSPSGEEDNHEKYSAEASGEPLERKDRTGHVLAYALRFLPGCGPDLAVDREA
jgi:hypothetical protein